MKKDLHPTYYPKATVTCACGNTFTVGSTVADLKTELCSKCHPFFTGNQKLVDTAHRVDDFKKRAAKAASKSVGHANKKVKQAKRVATRKAKQRASSKTAAE